MPEDTRDEISIHHPKDFPNPTTDKWDRRNYREPIKDGIRTYAEKEVDRDMEKPLEQLASDIHETYLRWDRLFTKQNPDDPTEQPPYVPTELVQMKDPVHLVLYALSRTSSLNAKVALTTEKLSLKLNCLTKVLIAFTIVIAVLTVFIAVPILSPWFK